MPVCRTFVAFGLIAAAGSLLSCSSGTPKAGATAQCNLNNPAAPPVPATVEAHALHNVHPIGSKMISGAVPDTDAAMDELRAMGVKTIISVDGATPDVAAAASRGMRYVHIPITYSAVTHDQQLELARAVRDLPGPIYIHCHHGKHRSPAAAAAVAVVLGEATPDDAVAFMKDAGTAPNYAGLYACVASAVIASTAAIDAAPHDFPSIRKPEGMTAAMVLIDLAYEHLGDIRAAEWGVPKDSPDLVPAAEAGQVADQLRFAAEDPRAAALGEDFNARLKEALAGATALENALARGASKDEIERAWKPVVASCKDCHAVYRDSRR